MFAVGLLERCTKAASAAKLVDVKNGKSDLSTLGIVFMAFLCSILPLDISQLAFAILLAVLYALLQKPDQHTAKKKVFPVVVNGAPYNAVPRTSKPKASSNPGNRLPPLPPIGSVEIRAPSVQPIVAPTFHSDGWDGEVQELLDQITPTAEAELIVNQLAQIVRKTLQSMIPELEVTGFTNGNLTNGKAFGVAVPEVDIVANVSPDVLLRRLHGRQAPGTPLPDAKQLQKTALRKCTDRLVAAGVFKFRRSAFRGQEPKVTLLAPASLGLFSDSIAIDFSVNVVTPLYNAALLTECGKMDSRAKELILLVKRWAKDRGICHAAKGHMSPYLWGLLTIYFLQVGANEEGPLLPPLDQFEMSSGFCKNKKRTSDTSKQAKWTPNLESKKSVGALFTVFVHFFETQFDWNKEAVSICSGERAPPSLELPLHIIISDSSAKSLVGPSIEDPFCPAQNLGDGMTAASLARLKEELSRAEALCVRGASLSELLEPWAPPEAAKALEVEEHGDAAPKSPAGKVAFEIPSKAGEMPWQRDAMEVQGAATKPVSTPPWRRSGPSADTRVTSECPA